MNPAQTIDLLDVTFTGRGAVRQRDGYGLFTSVAGTNPYDSLVAFSKSDGTRQLVAGAGNQLEGLSAGGAVIASVGTSASPHYFTRFGGPSVEAVYASNGTDPVRQWNGSAWSHHPGRAPHQRAGSWPSLRTNRLVNARRSGTTAGDNPSVGSRTRLHQPRSVRTTGWTSRR